MNLEIGDFEIVAHGSHKGACRLVLVGIGGGVESCAAEVFHLTAELHVPVATLAVSQRLKAEAAMLVVGIPHVAVAAVERCRCGHGPAVDGLCAK